MVPRVFTCRSGDLLRRLSSVFSFQLCFHTLLSFSLHVSLMVLFCFNEEFLGLKQAEVFVRTGPDPSAAVPGSEIKTKITQERRQSWHFHSIFNKQSGRVPASAFYVILQAVGPFLHFRTKIADCRTADLNLAAGDVYLLRRAAKMRFHIYS